MATYKDSSQVTRLDSSVFDTTYRPGTPAPHSGIYVCINCLDEDACNKGNPLPPQNHRQHQTSKGPILWRLLVWTQRGPD
jgi:hypothetical protein